MTRNLVLYLRHVAIISLCLGVQSCSQNEETEKPEVVAAEKAKIEEEKAMIEQEKTKIEEEKAMIAAEKAKIEEEKAVIAAEKAKIEKEKAKTGEKPSSGEKKEAKDTEEPAKPVSADSGKPESLTGRVSYSYGVSIAKQLQSRDVEINLGEFTRAYQAVIDGADLVLTEEEMIEAFDEMAEMQEQKVKVEGEEFLAENKKKEGVKTTDSGLQYLVLEEGDGPKPEKTDRVTVHYHGTLIDGTVFDSSLERGDPFSFGMDEVIPGWTEGVQLMPKGAKYRFFVPYNLAYGERGAGSDIKPYSTLIFDVELLQINGE